MKRIRAFLRVCCALPPRRSGPIADDVAHELRGRRTFLQTLVSSHLAEIET